MIKTYLKRIILLHNTNIASHSLLIRKLKYIEKMLLNTKHTKSLSLLNRKVKLIQLMRLHTKVKYELLPPEKQARLMETKTEQRHEHAKFKYYAMMLMHTGHNESPFLLRER
jgi:hypothetical protein